MRERRNPPELAAVNASVEASLKRLRAQLPPELDDDLTTVETYCAVAKRILAKTNPSKIRDATNTEWIDLLMPKETP